MPNLFLSIAAFFVLIVCSESVRAEPQQLSTETETTPQMVAVEVKLIEISRSKLSQAGLDMSKFTGQEVQALNGLEAFDDLPTKSVLGFVDSLLKNKIGRVLASPRITTLDGKEASLSVGSQVETKIGADTHFVQLGTKLDLEPKLLPDDKVQLDFRLEWVGRAPMQPETKAINNRRNYEIRTSIAPRLGESTLLARSLEVETDSAETEEVVLLLVVTPELVESTASAKGTSLK